MTTPNQEALVREAYRRSEKRLEAQLAISIAFDQRSYVLAVVAIASAAYVMGDGTADLGWPGGFVGAAIFFIASALLASLSALPQETFTAGSRSGELRDLIDADTDEVRVLLGLSVNNDKYIDINDRRANFRVNVYRLAVILFGCGLLIALIALLFPPSAPG